LVRKALFIPIVIMLIAPGNALALHKMWEKKYESNYPSSGNSVRETPDGGYIVAGTQWHTGGLQSDLLLLKTDCDGNKIWRKTFTLGEVDRGLSVGLTNDGGYIIAGSTWGWGEGKSDFCLVRVDADGNKIWGRTFGGRDKEYGYSVQQTSDGGYIVAGQTASFGAGKDDIYLIKTDTYGKAVWSKTFGGYNGDHAYSVQQTIDGGYIITGETNSFGLGDFDVYLIKTDVQGNESWKRTYGSKYRDCGRSAVQTTDGGYVIAGSTWRARSGYSAIYLIKTDSNGNELWSKILGGRYDDNAHSVQITRDGGYIVAGSISLFAKMGNRDVYLLRADGHGNKVWDETFGGEGYDCGYCVQQTRDGGYIVSGETNSFGSHKESVYLIKTYADGRQ
jgi:hypothetical protein